MEIDFTSQVQKAFVKRRFIQCDIHTSIEWVETSHAYPSTTRADT